MLTWIQEHDFLLVLLAALSPVSLLAIAAVVPLIIIRLPENYFSQPRRKKTEQHPHPILRLFVLFFKNMLGSLFVVAGIIMLFIPGQGVLTILIGIMLMNFPGKYRIERWLVRNTPVLKPLNWLRKKYHKPPLSL